MRMPRLLASRRLSRWAAAVLCIVPLLAGTAAAQDPGGDEIPPGVTITPSSGTFSRPQLSVTIRWCDETSLRSSTRRILLNNVDVTASFDYVTSSGCRVTTRSTGTVTLAVGSNTLYAEICDDAGNCGSRTATYTYDDKWPAVVDVKPHNGDDRDPSSCVVGCFDAVLAYATPLYVSRDTPRSVMLAYSSARAAPFVTVQLDVTDTSYTLPQKISLKLQRADATFEPLLSDGATEVFFNAGAGVQRLAVQLDARNRPTGVYNFTAHVTTHWSGATEVQQKPLRLLVVNERASIFGAGWSVAGLQRLVFHADSVMIVDGNGSATFFPRVSCGSGCTYGSPASDFTAVTSRATWPDGIKFDRKYPDGTTVSFDTAGRLAYVQDRYGNRTTFGYDASGRVASLTDAAGKQITLSYDANGKIDYITDAAGRISNLTVNAAGDLIEAWDPAQGPALRPTYDAEHRVTSWLDRRGGRWDVTYDTFGKIASDSAPAIVLGGLPKRLNTAYRAAELTLLAYRSSGKGTSANPADRLRGDTVRALVTSSARDSARFIVDRFGAATRAEWNAGQWGSAVRDDSGRVTMEVGPARDTVGGVSQDTVDYSWQRSNLVRTKHRRTGDSVRVDYETTYNQPTQIYGTLAASTWFWYGQNGRMDSTKTGAFAWPGTKFTYDASGRVLTINDPKTHVTTFYYASSGFQNTDSVRTGPRLAKFTYDAAGRAVTTTNPAGHKDSVELDPLNRGRVAVGALGDRTSFGYDSLFLLTVTDAKGQVYRFDRNAAGVVDSLTDPRGKVQKFSYDSLGNLERWVNRRGQTTTFTYDSLGRLLTRTLADGRVTWFFYDPSNRFVRDSSAEGIDTAFTEKPLGYGVSEQNARVVRGGVSYVVDRQFRNGLPDRLFFNRQGDESGKWVRQVSYLQSDGRITRVMWKDTSTYIDYNNDGLPIRYRLPTRDTVKLEWSSAHNLASIRYSAATIDQRFGRQITQDVLGRIAKLRNAAGDTARDFSYDPLGRLTGYYDFRETGTTCTWEEGYGQVCTPGTRYLIGSASFSYDSVGNRRDLGAVVETGNRLVAFDGYTLTYDDDGNLRVKSKPGVRTDSLFWNSVNQLDSVRTRDSLGVLRVVRFGYDGGGRRVRKAVDAATTYYVWAGDHVFVELDGAGIIQRTYSYYPGVDHPHGVQTDSTAVYYYLTDPSGNVTGLVDAAGAIVNDYRYKAFGGAEVTSEGFSNRLRFAAREFDSETGLYYNRARYYDPTLARFISEDPIGLGGGINPFAYSDNEPINSRDPFGLYVCEAGAGQCLEGVVVWASRGIPWGMQQRPMQDGDAFMEEIARRRLAKEYNELRRDSRVPRRATISGNPPRACVYAVLAAGVAWAEDAATLAGGAGILIKATRGASASVKLARAGRWVVSDRLALPMPGQRASTRFIAKFMGSHIGGAAYGGFAGFATGQGYGPSDWLMGFIPIVNAVDATIDAIRSCRA